jgi:hypothetical protein
VLADSDFTPEALPFAVGYPAGAWANPGAKHTATRFKPMTPPFRQELFAFESGQVKLNAANGEILSLKRFVRSSIGKPLKNSLLAISALISGSPKTISRTMQRGRRGEARSGAGRE